MKDAQSRVTDASNGILPHFATSSLTSALPHGVTQALCTKQRAFAPMLPHALETPMSISDFGLRNDTLLSAYHQILWSLISLQLVYGNGSVKRGDP